MYFDNCTWSPEAKVPIFFEQFIEKLYSGKLCSGFTEYGLKPTLKETYQDHKRFIDILVRELMHENRLVPSDITSVGTKEDFLFMLVSQVQYLSWSQELQKQYGKDWFKEEIQRLDKYRRYLQRYSQKTINIDFPNAPGDIIINLTAKIKSSKYSRLTSIIISHFKEHFGIKTARRTEREKRLEILK